MVFFNLIISSLPLPILSLNVYVQHPPPLSPETCSLPSTAGHPDLSRPVETTPMATTRRRWGARPIEASVDLAGVVDLARGKRYPLANLDSPCFPPSRTIPRAA
ncbi:unnamed protein product [Brassica oleracea]